MVTVCYVGRVAKSFKVCFLSLVLSFMSNNVKLSVIAILAPSGPTTILCTNNLISDISLYILHCFSMLVSPAAGWLEVQWLSQRSYSNNSRCKGHNHSAVVLLVCDASVTAVSAPLCVAVAEGTVRAYYILRHAHRWVPCGTYYVYYVIIYA